MKYTVIDCLVVGLQVHSSGNPDIVDTITGSHLVELSIVTAHCHDQIQDDIKNFADQLKPYPLVLFISCCKQIYTTTTTTTVLRPFVWDYPVELVREA